MKQLRSSVYLAVPLAIVCGLTAGCSDQAAYPHRPITLVCPWAAGGGTDRVSRQLAIFLEHELEVPVNVINATGGQGVTGHARGLLARPDGYTLTMMTLELNMLHWRGLTDLTWDSSEPLMSLNEDPAALFVRSESPFRTIKELEAAIRQRPAELTASGTASLGAWHLALAGWLLSFDRKPTDVVWIPSQGSAPSLQELMSGGIDMVCCSVPEARSLLDAGELRCLGVMADKRLDLPGLDRYPTLKEQGSDWTLTGWRGIGVPPGTPQVIQDTLVAALRRIVTGESEINGQTFPAYMDGEGFERTWRPTDKFAEFLDRSDVAFGRLLQREEFRSVKSGPIGPDAFPNVAGILAAGCLMVIGVSALRRRTGTAESTATRPQVASVRPSRVTWATFLFVPIATLAYALLADQVGFLLVAAAIMVGFSLLLGASLRVAVVLGIAGSAAIYQLFTAMLRVPLPPGWFGW